MARAHINLIVGAGSAATLTAALAGVAQADGYSVLDVFNHERAPVQASLVAEVHTPAAEGDAADEVALSGLSADARAAVPGFVTQRLSDGEASAEAEPGEPVVAAMPALPPLAPLPLGPTRSITVPRLPEVQVGATDGLAAPAPVATVDVSSYVPPAPAPTQVVTVAAAPAPAPTTVQTAPPPPAPTLAPAPTPPPAPPPPTATTKAS